MIIDDIIDFGDAEGCSFYIRKGDKYIPFTCTSTNRAMVLEAIGGNISSKFRAVLYRTGSGRESKHYPVHMGLATQQEREDLARERGHNPPRRGLINKLNKKLREEFLITPEVINWKGEVCFIYKVGELEHYVPVSIFKLDNNTIERWFDESEIRAPSKEYLEVIKGIVNPPGDVGVVETMSKFLKRLF